MTLSTDSYGTVAGCAAYVQHAANELGTFDADTTPTLSQVEGFLDRQSARLNGWLAQNNYGVPVTNARAAAWLAYYAEIGAAGLIELTQRSSGYDDQDQNRRENKFLQEFARAQKEIASGVLAALGAQRPMYPASFSAFVSAAVHAAGRHCGRYLLGHRSRMIQLPSRARMNLIIAASTRYVSIRVDIQHI
jgi:hypothetical protein